MTWKPVDQMLDKVGLGFVDRLPSAWDYANWQFKSRAAEGGWMIIYLTDGSVTGGIARSVSTSRQIPDVFLAQVWNLDDDGNLVSPKPDNMGLWVRHDQIQRIEYYIPWEATDYAQLAIPEFQDATDGSDQTVDRNESSGIQTSLDDQTS